MYVSFKKNEMVLDEVLEVLTSPPYLEEFCKFVGSGVEPQIEKMFLEEYDSGYSDGYEDGQADAEVDYS